MNAERLLAHYEDIAEAPDAIERLRQFILELAVRGKLVPQVPADEDAGKLLRRIAAEKARLESARKIRAPKPLPAVVEPFDIPSGWQWSQLAEIGILSPRNEAPDDLPASFVPMPLIAAEYGAPNRHEVRTWGKIKKGYTHFSEGDVGLAKITPCFQNGKSTVFRNLTGGLGSGTTELHVVRPIFVNPDYVVLFLKSPHFIDNGIPLMTGTAGQKRVSTAYFAHSPFPLPPVAEQHRIVAKVDELMGLCGELERTRSVRERARDRLTAASLARLNIPTSAMSRADACFALDALPALTTRPGQIKQLRRAILNFAVQGKLVAQDPNDEPALKLVTEAAKEIADYSRANRVALKRGAPLADADVPFSAPLGWEWVRLASLFRVITDGDHQPPPQSKEGVAFLTIGNITTGQLDFAGCRLVPEVYYQSLPRYRTPERGDILYTVVGATYGRPALVETDRVFCVQRHIAMLKPAKAINLRFLATLLASPLIYDQASGSTTGAAQPTVALRPLRNFVAPLPPLAEQNRIVAKVDQLMALCDALEAGLCTAEATRRRLLDALLAEALAPVRQEAA